MTRDNAVEIREADLDKVNGSAPAGYPLEVRKRKLPEGILISGDGNDFLEGGLGNDFLEGGEGLDT